MRVADRVGFTFLRLALSAFLVIVFILFVGQAPEFFC